MVLYSIDLEDCFREHFVKHLHLARKSFLVNRVLEKKAKVLIFEAFDGVQSV